MENFNFDADTSRLEAALARFNFDAKVTEVKHGPLIDTYTVMIPPGVRSSRLNLIADDLARLMKVETCRVAPDFINGAILLEMAKGVRTPVKFWDVMRTQSNKVGLPLVLGVDTEGMPVVADLTTMPHLLLAGTTGSGKSMMLNSIILSLMIYNSPKDCRLLLIDPKVLEFVSYTDAKHLHVPPVTTPDNAIVALKMTVMEMEERYRLLAAARCRNIAEYRAKAASTPGMKNMPYFVVIVDEMADLMQTAGKVVESAVQRIAQLARAAGIHLIMATQRPSVDVITGVIKANFPVRMAFKVASKIDSRVILDTVGAEKLLGKGDALVTLPTSANPVRVHGALVTDADIAQAVRGSK